MIRSLFNGLSGVQGHQVQMDVIGSNIANINTVGYKKAQVTFEDALNLTLKHADSPRNSRGGINPTQIGLGTRVGAIKNTFTQGSLLETGNVTDIAIIGNGFFVVNDGTTNFYTRAGNFHFDTDGTLVNNQGFKIQGKQANLDGEISPDAVVGNIQLPAGSQIPAGATSKVSFSGNLNAEEPLLGTVTSTEQYMATAGATEDFNGLFANGKAETFLNLVEGLDTLTIGDQSGTETFIYGVDFRNSDDLASAITTAFAGRFSAAVGGNGQITFASLTGNITLTGLSNTSSGLDTAFKNIDGTLLLNTGDTVDSDEFAHVATNIDTLATLRNSQGKLLDLQVGDDITLLSATVGDDTVSSTSLIADMTATTTLEELRGAIQTNLFGSDRRPEEKVTLEFNGQLKIHGGLGTDREIMGINIGAGVNPNEDNRALFGTSTSFTEEQAAKDVSHTATTTVFDDLGEAHTLRIIFKKTNEPAKWAWTADLTGSESVRGGSSGLVTFNRDGSLKAFEYDGNASSFSFDPNNDSDFVDMDLNVGVGGSFDGLTQFAASSTAAVISQDGYALGSLEVIGVDETGTLSASFSNGLRRTVAQISLAQFNNPQGLTKVEGNLFSASVNSGSPVLGAPGTTINAQIASGALEQSNVDLAEEFTRLITAQRGFQANSRVITTSSDVLNELVNLKQ